MSMLHEVMGLVPRLKKSQRKGRGESSGRGKTCGRGTKGSKARVGTYIKRGYEGGQTQIAFRFPKRGFSNVNFERRFYIVNVGELERFAAGATVDAVALIDVGLVRDVKQPVKILGVGSLSKKLTVVAGWYSHSALEKITKAGGAAQNLKGDTFEFPKPKKRFVLREQPKKLGKKAAAAAEAAAAPAAGAGPAETPAGAAEKPAQAKQAPAARTGPDAQDSDAKQ
jgi:large subunit ribosomal protein L15